MKRLSNKVALLMCSALTAPLHGALLVTGGTGTTAGLTSNSVILARAMHRPSGTLILTTSGLNSNNSIMTVSRPSTTDTTVTASGIAADTTLRNATITNVAVVSDPTTPADATKIKIATTQIQATAGNRETAVYLITPTGGTAVVKTLKDGVNTSTTSKIMALAGGNTPTISCLFAAVKKNGAVGSDFASSKTGDAIASIIIDNTTLAMTTSTIARLDTVITHSLSFGHPGSEAEATGNPCMAYDEESRRLYVGIGTITTDSTSALASTSAAYSIAIYDVADATGVLTQLCPTGANNPVTPLVGGAQYIVGQRGEGNVLKATNIRVMTTSTGPSASNRFKYLILNGGHGTSNGNQVWAIPLVVGSGVANNNGTFAKVTTGNFASPAAAAGDLYITTSAAAKVGNGPLPIPNNGAIADMHVDGDAVYVSISTATSATAKPGLYVSQAIFDHLGKISSWTEWHKIAPNVFGNTEATNRTGLFSIDAVTGHIIAADQAGTHVRMSQWTNTSLNQDGTANTKGLVYNLNTKANVGDGCTAVCDLNHTTTAWGNLGVARMALFGGRSGKVCFAMTGSAQCASAGNNAALVTTNTALEMTFDTSSATTALDYSSSTTLLLSTLPTGAGTVRSLSHSGWYPTTGSTTPGFFFAGAETGNGNGALYVYCLPSLGVGHNPRNTTNFLGAPFTAVTGGAAAHTWQQLNRIDGIPVKIEAKGGAVYILTRKVDASGTATDRIFRLTRQITGAALNTNFIVTATAGVTSGASDLSAVKHIYDFVVSQTGAGTEQLAMVTNDGIYTTTSATGCDAAGYNNDPSKAMLNCGWTKVSSPTTATGFMLKIFGQTHTRTPQTFYSAQWQASVADSAVYDKVALVQYGRATNPTAIGVWPLGQDAMINFNANDGTTTVPTGLVELPVVTNFWTDGARRFATTVSRSTSSHVMSLLSLPFRVDAKLWNHTAPYTVGDAQVANLGAVYWIRPIAGTVMVGTSNGVYAQQ